MIRIFEDYVFMGRVSFLNLPDITLQDTKGETSIKVTGVSGLVCKNTGAVTVTNFTGGMAGQAISILGEGQTTIQNNAVVKTNTGANKLLAANKVYRFTLFNDIWYEDA